MGERGSRSSWDSKHKNTERLGSPQPFLLSLIDELPRGRCLDLAAGRGANALFMARRGYRVDAVDWSFEALRRAAGEASRQDRRLTQPNSSNQLNDARMGSQARLTRLDVSNQAKRRQNRLLPALNFLVADLTSYPLPVARYDVLLCFRYLERSLWQDMERALRPGGAFLMETFTERHRRDHPDFPAAYCLAPGELRRAFPLLKVALYHESRNEGAASLFALRP